MNKLDSAFRVVVSWVGLMGVLLPHGQAQSSTGYNLNGKSPLCWENDSQEQVKCPSGVGIEIMNLEKLSKVEVLQESRGTFEVTLPNRLTNSGESLSVIKAPNGYIIYHANFHACADSRFCTPFVQKNTGLITTSENQSKNPDLNGRAIFDQALSLPQPGLYQVVAHIQFWTRNQTGSTKLWDVASAISMRAYGVGDENMDKNDESKGGGGASSTALIIGVIAGVVALASVVVAFIVFRRKQRGRYHGHPDYHQNFEFYAVNQTPTQSYLVDGSGGSSSRLRSNKYDDLEAIPMKMDGSDRSMGHTGSISSFASAASSIRNGMRASESDDSFRVSSIDAGKIAIMEVVGSGSFGEVLRGEYSGSCVAIKRMHAYMQNKELDSFTAEIKLIMGLRHPNIVQFIGTTVVPQFGLCAVTEYMSRGDLTTVLQNATDNMNLCWNGLKSSIAIDSALGLAYLHGLEPAIIHRDLKSRNILISDSFTAKLSDFGLSRTVSCSSTMTVVGSNLWLAPEMIRGERFSEKADIFSFGVVLAEMDTEKLPYHGIMAENGNKLNGVALAHQVAFKGLRPSTTLSCPAKLRTLIDWCLNDNPDRRPNAVTVLKVLRELATDLRGSPPSQRRSHGKNFDENPRQSEI